MSIASSTYWNAIHGFALGEVEQDEEGVQTLRNLAKNMEWLVEMREATKDSIQTPDSTKTARANFVR